MGAGYTASELIRILLHHEFVELGRHRELVERGVTWHQARRLGGRNRLGFLRTGWL
jgi:hypothetical protein